MYVRIKYGMYFCSGTKIACKMLLHFCLGIFGIQQKPRFQFLHYQIRIHYGSEFCVEYTIFENHRRH